MSRLTKKFNDNSGYEVEEYGAKYNEVKLDAYLDAVNKLGKLEDLEEEIGVNNLIAFLEWCVKFRNNFINRSFDDMVAFYKRAMCETEKG